MSEIARRITGMSAQELRDYDFPRLHSQDQINFIVPRSRYWRLTTGRIVTSDEIDQERAALDIKQKALFRKFGFKPKESR